MCYNQSKIAHGPAEDMGAADLAVEHVSAPSQRLLRVGYRLPGGCREYLARVL